MKEVRVGGPSLVNNQIAEIQHQLEKLQQNNNPRNPVMRDLLEEIKFSFCEHYGTSNPAEHLETYKS